MEKVSKEKKKVKTKYDIAYICMAVIAVLIILGTGTYAYYQSTIAGTTNGTIAKWSFKANNQAETFNLDFGSLYPGKSDVKYIELSAEDSELDVYYELLMDDIFLGTTIHQDLVPNILWWDANSTMPIGGLCTSNAVIGRYGTIPAGSEVSAPIYLNWPYTSDDLEEIATDASELTGVIFVLGQQYTGYSGTSPMKLLQALDPEAVLTYTNGFIYVECR